jgi:hypothetical protein
VSEVAKWLIIALLTWGTLSSVAMVGKPRVPLQPFVAVLTVVFNGLIIAAILAYWGAS